MVKVNNKLLLYSIILIFLLLKSLCISACIDINAHGSKQDSLVEAASFNPIPKPRSRTITPNTVAPEVPKRKPPLKPDERHIVEDELKTENQEAKIETVNKGEESISEKVKEDLVPEVGIRIVGKETSCEANNESNKHAEDNSTNNCNPRDYEEQQKPSETLEAAEPSHGCLITSRPPEIVEFLPKVSTEIISTADIEDSCVDPRIFENHITLANTLDLEKTKNSNIMTCADVSSNANNNAFSIPSGSMHQEKSIFHVQPGMYEVEYQFGRKYSISSVKSEQTLSDFDGGLRKWNNLEELNDLSLASSMGPNNSSWVLGEESETGMSLFNFLKNAHRKMCCVKLISMKFIKKI